MTKDNENRGANLCSEHFMELPAWSITFGFILADMFCIGEVKPLVLPCIHPFAQVVYLIMQLSLSNPQMCARRVALRSLRISKTTYRMVKQRSKIELFHKQSMAYMTAVCGGVIHQNRIGLQAYGGVVANQGRSQRD